jgi:hypothetical protein
MRRAGFGEAPDALGTLLAAATAGSSAGLHGLALLLDGPKTAPEEITESVSPRAVELRGVRVERGQERAREAKRNEFCVGPRSVLTGASHVDPSNRITVSWTHGLAARENRITVSWTHGLAARENRITVSWTHGLAARENRITVSRGELR